jgi:hypothetical protein
MKDYIVVFDGTSAYIIPKEELSNDVIVVKDFDDIDEADIFCEEYNNEISDVH